MENELALRKMLKASASELPMYALITKGWIAPRPVSTYEVKIFRDALVDYNRRHASDGRSVGQSGGRSVVTPTRRPKKPVPLRRLPELTPEQMADWVHLRVQLT